MPLLHQSMVKPRPNRVSSNAAALANHQRLVERDALMKRFGYDFAAGVQFVLAQAMPLAGSVLEVGTGKGRFMLALAPHLQEVLVAWRAEAGAREQTNAKAP